VIQKFSPKTIHAFLKTRFPNKAVLENVVERVRLMHLRFLISQYSVRKDEQSLRDCVARLDRTISESKNSKRSLSLFQILPVASACLALNDLARCKSALAQYDQNHFAILNNHGVLELVEKRYSSALMWFSKALNANKTFPEVAYNIGLSLLLSQKPKKAFKYLHSIIPVSRQNPYVWLRLAECCVSYFRVRVTKLRRRNQLSSVVARRLNTSSQTFTILAMSDSKLFCLHNGGSEISLEFGQKACKIAMQVCGEEQNVLKQKATLLCQYICLELGDWQQANELSKSVTANSTDQVLRFLSRIYASQACFMMHDLQNSCGLLRPLLIELSLSKMTAESAVMLYQTAWRAFQANQDLEKSLTYKARACELDAGCREIVLTKVATELQNKMVQNAVSALNSYKPKDE
jgi:CCR4-NOT transcription complex subunit 10